MKIKRRVIRTEGFDEEKRGGKGRSGGGQRLFLGQTHIRLFTCTHSLTPCILLQVKREDEKGSPPRETFIFPFTHELPHARTQKTRVLLDSARLFARNFYHPLPSPSPPFNAIHEIQVACESSQVLNLLTSRSQVNLFRNLID